ncbi:PVC-type heme-binding CxxCH protein [Halomicrobium salinisoli]|uniref:PVC-type heme-binding CxxCH protein n=1 Tax=Halomicrobium salinisoli TaxID=2878391 RepID=UPI001CF0173E|nr:PVC-type heme-binding CxxCH protein [Halomicrobium salinisoli]
MTDEDCRTSVGAGSHPQTYRRRFMKAAGLGALGLTGLNGTAGAQSGDNRIRLEAVTIDVGGGRGRSEYVWEDGEEGLVRGPPDAVCNVAGGNHVWMGVSPSEIADVVNPTLELTAGETYTVEWTNTDGETHNFVVVDDEGTELVSSTDVSGEGETQSVEFEATEEMAEYYCRTHSGSQSGSIHVGDGGPFELSGLEPTEATVEHGETASVSVTVTNATDESATDTVTLVINGQDVASQEVSLDGGAQTTVTFDVDTSEMAGGELAMTISSGDSRVSGTLVIEGGPDDAILEVLYLGGVEDGATHYSEDLLKVLGPYMLERGVRLHYTERQADLNAETLAHYDAVMLYGNRLEPTEAQIDALIEFVEDGGGFVPVHSASASFTSSDRFVDLVGGQFQTHNDGVMTTDRIQPDHPVYEGVDEIEVWEETYRHQNVADDIEVLAYGAGADFGADENEPWNWVRTQGDGRVFYTAWGHSDVWETSGFKQLLHNALRWASGNEDTIGDHPMAPEKTYTNVSEYGHSEVPYYQGDAPDAVSSEDDGVWDLVQDPFPVADSMAHSITPAEFELEYFVSEDILPDGIEGEILDMTFDAAGRCFISLTQDYPNDPGTGDDMIVICEDADGDGTADEFTVFEENLSIPHSLIPHRDGVIAAEVGTDESGRVVYLGDEDGDDVADVEEVVFTGYGTGDTHAGLNQLYWGHDNWIYGVVGYAGLTPSIDEDLSLSQDVFRFRPDGSEIEYVGGGASNMAGVKTNEEGLVFCSSATAGNNVTSYAAIPAAYYDYINGFEGYTTIDIRSETNLSRTENENRILPINNRYRQVDFHGGFTAATDQEIYTAREFPEQYWNSTTFVSDGTGQLTSTYYLEQDGAGYESIYHHNLFASNDEWSSPTYVNTGPDGMVWLIDMYDFVFQHNPTPEGYENGPGNAYESAIRDTQHSRLYRVTTGGGVDPHPQDLSDASTSELVDALGEDNMFWRQTAQRKLIEQDATEAVDDLVSLATTENLDDIGLDVAAIHALWTLEGLDAVTDNADALRDALTHSSAGVRLNALRVLPPTADTRDAILEHDLLNDPDGRVQMWALLTLAETPESDAAGQAIYEMITQEENASDNLLIDAASVGAASHAESFVSAYEANEDTSDNDQQQSENLFENPSFEETQSAVGPDGWSTNTFGGSADYTYVEGTAHSGDHSVQISSSDGADAVWYAMASVEPETEYTLSGWIRTEQVETQSDSALGALFNVHTTDYETDVLTGTNDWTEVSVTFTTGADVSELQINALFGGYGNATGTAWFDDVSLTGPDGTNLLSNGGFESGTSSSQPTAWETNNWQGTQVEFTHDASVSRSGDYSVRVESTEGADASWTQTFEVEPNTEYRFSAYVKTGEDFAPDTGFGATLNVHELGQDSLANAVTESGQDWTEISTTINSGSNNQLTFNCLYGGWGFATGTAWWDDASLVQLSGFGDGHEQVYDRVKTHLDMMGVTAEFTASTTTVTPGEEVTFDAADSSSPDGAITSYEWAFGDGSSASGESVSHTYDSAGEYDVTLTVTDEPGATDSTTTTVAVEADSGALDPSATIQLDGYTDGWEATAPDAIAGDTNPTLQLQEGAEYTVEFVNADGNPHDFAVQDSAGDNVAKTDFVMDEGGTASLTFTASTEIVTYLCTAHPDAMIGDVEVV